MTTCRGLLSEFFMLWQSLTPPPPPPPPPHTHTQPSLSWEIEGWATIPYTVTSLRASVSGWWTLPYRGRLGTFVSLILGSHSGSLFYCGTQQYRLFDFKPLLFSITLGWSQSECGLPSEGEQWWNGLFWVCDLPQLLCWYWHCRRTTAD